MRLRIKIYGIVQGVFFRTNAMEKSTKLGLKGWVMNNKDGSVEILADGKEEKIKELVEWCKIGPGLARIDRIEITEEKPKEKLHNFKIRY